MAPKQNSDTAETLAPAKLNLHLELLGKRADGFHEIDTVMVAIDLCDHLTVRRTAEPGIRLSASWIEPLENLCHDFGFDPDDPNVSALLAIPQDDTNLVHRALAAFTRHFDVDGGFDVQLRKRIPAGAGMGGASSDAAAAIRCAAGLHGMINERPGSTVRSDIQRELHQIAASIGSDVPFFLGGAEPIDFETNESSGSGYARATGRGEQIKMIPTDRILDLVVVYPPVALSTAKVYAQSVLPKSPITADELVDTLQFGNLAKIAAAMHNRLSEPAAKIVPRIDEILRLLWQTGLKAVQLTGSGSACFGIADSHEAARTAFTAIKDQIHSAQGVVHSKNAEQTGSGALIFQTQTTSIPTEIQLH